LSITLVSFCCNGLLRSKSHHANCTIALTIHPVVEDYDLKENLPKWDGETCDDNTFNGHYKADNQDNLGDKAPVGKTCDRDQLQAEGCGFKGLKDILSGVNSGLP
jgi:hypothetical protein